MPTYTQTRNTVTASQSEVNQIKSNIRRTKDLGNGYQVKIEYRVDVNKVRARFTGPSKTVDRIPHAVIIKYAQVLNRINKWLNDEEPDFPEL